MRTYANPALCPDCDAPTTGGDHCTTCGLPLSGPLASRLLWLLSEADAVLGQLRTQAAGAPERDEPSEVRTGTPRPVVDPARRLSASAVLLMLGALCLVVAAVVFVAVAWGSLSLSSRTLILVAVTGVAFATAAIFTGRRLPASAEAVWSISWLLWGLDMVAARTTGLFGLSELGLSPFLTLTGALLAVPATAAAAWSRSHAGRTLVSAALAALAGLTSVLVAADLSWSHRIGWFLAVTVPIAAAAAVAYERLRLHVVSAGVVAATVTVFTALWCDALASVWTEPDLTAVWGSGALALSAVTVVYAVSAGAAALGRSHGHVAVPAAVVLAGVQVASWALAPAWHRSWEAAVVVLALATVGCAATGWLAASDWNRGLSALGWLGATVLAVASLPWVASIATTIWATAVPVWRAELGVRLEAGAPFLGGAWWAASLSWATVGVVLLLGKWRSRWVRHLGTAVVVSAAMPPLFSHDFPAVVVVLVMLAVAATALMLGVWREQLAALAAGAAVLAIACALALPAASLSALTWGVGAVCLAGLATGARSSVVAKVAAGAGCLLGFGAVLALLDVTAAPWRTTVGVTVGIVAALAISAQWRALERVRPALEIAAIGLAAFPLGLAVLRDADWVSIVLTVLGAAAVAVSLLATDRRPVAIAGGVLLNLALWVRLGSADVEVVEAYTLPAGVVLVALGLWSFLRRPVASQATLLPGLLLCTTPSLPMAFTEPGSLRGLLLGLAGLVLLGAGVRWRVAAPFCVGAGVVALLAVAHLTPYAAALPRWVLLAAAGIGLLVAGVTWERRVRDLRSAVQYVSALR